MGEERDREEVVRASGLRILREVGLPEGGSDAEDAGALYSALVAALEIVGRRYVEWAGHGGQAELQAFRQAGECAAAGLERPSVALARRRAGVLDLIAQGGFLNPRVVGSVARGEDTALSDLDLLLDAGPGTTILHVSGLIGDLEDFLGVRVDVITSGALKGEYGELLLAEARPL